MKHKLPVSEIPLEEKLEKIAKLEAEHSIVGVSFAVQDRETILTEECADSVIQAITRGVALLREIDKIPLRDPLAEMWLKERREHGA